MVIFLLFNQIILPLAFTIWLYRKKPRSRSNFILNSIFTGSLILFAWVLGPQAWTSVYVGIALVIFFLITITKKIRELPKSWAFDLGDSWGEILFTIIQCLILMALLSFTYIGLSGYTYDKEAINLQFPLDNGVYIVGHGGNHPLINYHNVSQTQAYALDISKLNAIGTRASGFRPNTPEEYAIFGSGLYSPCDAEIVDVKTGLPDMNPPERGEGHPAGNHIVLSCENAEITIAHLKQFSITVEGGQSVTRGELIGQIGNSGNTTEPHLHIHAVRDSTGVPILFNGRFLVRNSIVWR